MIHYTMNTNVINHVPINHVLLAHQAIKPVILFLPLSLVLRVCDLEIEPPLSLNWIRPRQSFIV